MPTDSSKSRNCKLLGTKGVAELLLPFSSSGAEWYMTATQLSSHESAVPALEIVVWEAGQELGRWPLHAMAYGSLVSGLVQQPEGPFAIPHAKGFVYDEYAEVDSRLAAAGQVLAELIPPYNALLHRMSRTARTAGLSVSQVSNWLKQAEHTLNTTKGQVLCQLMTEVGPPRYATHSSYLPELLPAVQQGTKLLKDFLIDSLPPTTSPGAREQATVGVEESKWDWAELNFRKGGLSADFSRLMYDYLPETKFLEAPFAFPDDEPAINPGGTQSPKILERASESAVRTHLLEIRQRVDDLLASLD
jgi:hypothetical protein